MLDHVFGLWLGRLGVSVCGRGWGGGGVAGVGVVGGVGGGGCVGGVVGVLGCGVGL